MKILGIECSATPASVALIDDGKVVASSYINIKLTHSQTLLPMLTAMLKSANVTLDSIDGITVANGPGSFTGIRIGISAVKGLAAPTSLPCVAVSTLRGMAEAFKGESAIVCAVMDARCNQVYNALFRVDGDNIIRLCDDRALMCSELAEEISKIGENIIICGDGADIFYPFVCENDNIRLANETQKFQSAVGVGLASIEDFKNGNTLTPAEILPKYLRLPQAERELKKKTGDVK